MQVYLLLLNDNDFAVTVIKSFLTKQNDKSFNKMKDGIQLTLNHRIIQCILRMNTSNMLNSTKKKFAEWWTKDW